MAQIAYLLLCHGDPAAVIAQARTLATGGDHVVIHYDRRAPHRAFRQIRANLAGERAVHFVPRRHRCGWGEWSLVAATLALLRAGLQAVPGATHFYLVSADCAPIKSRAYIHAALDAQPRDYIGGEDFQTTDWIKTGWKDERLIYRHWFNERRRRRAFYAMAALQARWGLARRLPAGLPIKIGPQWWCLRRDTVTALLAFLVQRPDLVRFFRWTWIPDEVFLQSVVAHLVPPEQRSGHAPTLAMFSDYGMPVTFHDDHETLLIGQPAFFARKISAHARALRERLPALYRSDSLEIPQTDAAAQVYRFLTQQGRTGTRYASRFWEAGSVIGEHRTLCLILCKKREIGTALARAMGDLPGMAAVGYLFSDPACVLPDLGGIEASLPQRHRHRRVVMRLLFDVTGARTLVACVDPEDIEILRDLDGDPATVRMLEIDCAIDEDWLRGHLARAGLARRDTPDHTKAELLSTMRNKIARDARMIRMAGFRALTRVRQGDPLPARIAALAQFAGVPDETVTAHLAPGALFADAPAGGAGAAASTAAEGEPR